MNDRFFIESSINYEIGNRFSLNLGDNQTLGLSSSLGAMKPITKSLYAIGGLSNYTELNNDNLNEVFFGTISRYFRRFEPDIELILSAIFHKKSLISLSKQNGTLLDVYAFIFNNSAHKRAGPKLWI